MRVVFVDLGDTSKETEVVLVTLWYKKGIPTKARRIGFNVRRVDTTFAGSPDRPTSVPRRVCRGCDGESVTLSREYGLPRTSNSASVRILD